MTRNLLLILGLIVALMTFGQEGEECAEPTDKKIIKLLAEARSAKDPMDGHRALKATLEEDPGCARCLFETGKSAYYRAKASGLPLDAAERYFNRLSKICPDFHHELPYFKGIIAYQKGDNQTATSELKRFEEMPFTGSDRQRKNYDKKLAKVQEILPELSFSNDFYKNSGKALNPQVVKNISTRDDEYLPMLSPDNELIFFTRKSQYKAKGDIVGKEVERLTQADRADVFSDFNSGLAMESPFNVGDNYGGVTLSVNNKEMFVCACKPVSSSYSNCDIYRTHFDLKFNPDNAKQQWSWSGLEALGPEINGSFPDGAPSWEAQPSLSGDGKLLFFTRYVLTETGGQHDIYYAERKNRTEWSEAKPLPPSINTAKDEKVPFMHSDSKTLYFSSNGLKGAGGYDIFYTRLKADGSWTTPKNMGHPVNSDKDETGLIVSTDGRTAYFASDRFKGVGKYDIYAFELPEEARPDEVLIVKGKVANDAGKAVKDATIEIQYMDTREVETIKVDEQDGGYAAVVSVNKGQDVMLTVKKEGHVFDSRVYSEEDASLGGVAKANLQVKKIEVGKNYRVNDINYATNSAEIKKSSMYILENLIAFLEENPTIKIAIHGHTDNVGGISDNLALSKDRAATVMEYLLEKGIKASRLSFDGFGPNKPVASNDSESGRSKNRRTEFVIVSK